MTGQSKLLTYCTCREFLHPWTEKCVNASAGIILASTPYCLKMYTVVYLVSLLMKQRKVSADDIKRMIKGIIQSSAFLVTNAYTFVLYNCLIRRLLGCYYFSTVAFWPSLLASYSAILVERPQRRSLLALYVANIATETVWNMLKSRGLVVSVPHGELFIFGFSMTVLLYMRRLGLHKTICKDSIFDIIRVLLDKHEESTSKLPPSVTTATDTITGKNATQIHSDNNNTCKESIKNNTTTSEQSTVHHHNNRYHKICNKILHIVKQRHESCPHKDSCFNYIIIGGLKPLLGGVGVQVIIRILLNLKHIIQRKRNIYKNIFTRKTLHIGLFLGCFSFLYKFVSCSLRHTFGCDDARYAIPAGLLSSIGFLFYPNKTIALYVMWKMLQITYNLGIKEKKLPRIPHFTIIMYSICTAMLFHAGILEPRTIRQSYYKFLEAISGERLSKFNMTSMDIFGMDTSAATNDVKHHLRLIGKSQLPKYSLATW